MLKGCPGCPYKDFKYFYDYYGTPDYAHQWIEAAFDGESTNFRNGNADFSRYGFEGRQQVIQKGLFSCMLLGNLKVSYCTEYIFHYAHHVFTNEYAL